MKTPTHSIFNALSLEAATISELQELTELTALFLDKSQAIITFFDTTFPCGYLTISKVPVTQQQQELIQLFFNRQPSNGILYVPNLNTENPLDEKNKFVCDSPFGFFASAPLVLPNGTLVGTLAVLETHPATLSKNQQKALEKQAYKVMQYVTCKNRIAEEQNSIRKIAQHIPSVLFQLRRTPEGNYSYDFFHTGNYVLPDEISSVELKKNPFLGFDLVHAKDKEKFMTSLEESAEQLKPWMASYRLQNDAQVWHTVNALPELQPNKDVVWYGVYQDITHQILYDKVINQITFDISHILRRPVTTLMGIVQLLKNETLTCPKKSKEFINHIQQIAEELNGYTTELHDIYYHKKTIDQSRMFDGTPRKVSSYQNSQSL